MLWLERPSRLVKPSKLRDTHKDFTIVALRAILVLKSYIERENSKRLANFSSGLGLISKELKTRHKCRGRKVAKFFSLTSKCVAGTSILVLGLATSGCLVTRNEAKEVERKNMDQVITLQRSAADQSTKFSEIDNELRVLNGRIEVLENRVVQYQAQSHEKLGGESLKTQEMERRMLLLQEEIKRLTALLDATIVEVGALKAGANAKIPVPTGKKGAFEIAEDLYAKKEWRKAVLAYQKFRDDNPKSKRFPTATLRIGQCFMELGMKDDARTFFEEVVAKYPKSDEAKQARNLLKKK